MTNKGAEQLGAGDSLEESELGRRFLEYREAVHEYASARVSEQIGPIAAAGERLGYAEQRLIAEILKVTKH
jgi:hypothetical protein